MGINCENLDKIEGVWSWLLATVPKFIIRYKESGAGSF